MKLVVEIGLRNLMPFWLVCDYHGGSRLMRDFIELPFLRRRFTTIIVGVQWKWTTFSISVQASGIVALTRV